MEKTELVANYSGDIMNRFEPLAAILAALPDPAFILSRSGKYVAVLGGQDNRYYHDGSSLVGCRISDVIKPDKANWFIETIGLALHTRKLLIEEYELSNKDVLGLPDEGPTQPIWFEGRIQALDFLVDDEEVVLWVASNISRRHELELKLREQSDKDQLTGLYNRWRLEQDLALQHESLARYAVSTAVLLFDLDNLKQINDTLGHESGDQAIVAIANTCLSQLRKTDKAYRLGGDEFVVVLPNIDLAEAIQFADRLRELFNAELHPFQMQGEPLSVSMGVTILLSSDPSYKATLRRADSALYRAKRGGKNQVVAGE